MDIESDMRGTLRNFGLKVGAVSSIRYEARIRDLVEGFPRLAAIIEPLLTVRRVMRQQLATLHKLLLNAVRVDPVCRRFMTVPGVGPIVALTYRASVDQPHRFIHSKAVGAHVGLTPKRHQSGEIDYDGGVSKCGDSMLRDALRSRAVDANPQQEMVMAEGVGHAGCSAARDGPCHRGSRQAARGDPTPHVGRRH